MDEKNLQEALDAIKDGVGRVSTKLSAQASAIADLKAQLAAGTPVTQDQLEALATEANGIVATMNEIAPPAAV